MKKLLFFLSIILMEHVSAQTWVTIPDSRFVSYLQMIIPAAMNGNQMDITNPLVTTTTHSITFTGNYSPPASISGVEYFSSLTYLNCSLNGLTFLPNLPSILKYLDCSSNSLTSLPVLPNSITDINCNNASLTSLPTLPNSLNYLHCSGNSLTTLPALPNSLAFLDCSVNSLTNLPTLDTSLQTLDCYHNSLTSLPTLPNSLTYLRSSVNPLSTLPSLPNALTYLECQSNHLTNLPILDTLLNSLDCRGNSLTNLPALPNSLKSLYCGSNSLNSLPILPDSLQILFCHGNNITCFPTFPNTITPAGYNSQYGVWTYWILLDPNPYNCLPNYLPNSMTPTDLAKPLCTGGNSNGCAVATGVNQITKIVNNQLSVYPNPSDGLFNLKINQPIKSKRNIVVTLYDNTGRQLDNVPFTQTDDYTLQINLTGYAQGLYMVKTEIDNVLYTAKLER